MKAIVLKPKEALRMIESSPLGWLFYKVGCFAMKVWSRLRIIYFKTMRAFRFVWAIFRCEFKTMWTGRQHCVIASDFGDHFSVMSLGVAAGLFKFAKRRLFMRRPEMRKRFMWPKY